MSSKCLPSTYNPTPGHACSVCAGILMKDYSCVFNKKQSERGGSRRRKKAQALEHCRDREKG